MKKLISILLISTLLLSGCSKEVIKDNPEQKPTEPILENVDPIVDPNSKTRPFAIMINNYPDARPYQSGLDDAYLVYEMLVEYGITRLMAVFKDQTTERIGSIRSSRHTYLDYALENDAYYVHFGWSNIAQEQIPKLGVDNINGMYDGGFWRDQNVNAAYEHKVCTSIEKLSNQLSRKKYRAETNKKLLLNYSLKELDISKYNAKKANKVSLKFSTSNTTTFEYDSDNGVYKRFVNGVENIDFVTKKQFTAKNIIAVKIENYTVDEFKHQELNNIGEGNGYYITNGYAAPIKWYKTSRDSQTVYKYLNGEEITVNNGNTYIEIVPLNSESIVVE